MAYLFDAHALIWWWTASPRLSEAASDAIRSGEQDVFVSVASIWEIAIKSARGRLPEIEDFRADYPLLMARDGFRLLEIGDDHAIRAAWLDSDHRDPFDRMIAAQALVEALTVLTCDRAIAQFGCKVLW